MIPFLISAIIHPKCNLLTFFIAILLCLRGFAVGSQGWSSLDGPTSFKKATGVLLMPTGMFAVGYWCMVYYVNFIVHSKSLFFLFSTLWCHVVNIYFEVWTRLQKDEWISVPFIWMYIKSPLALWEMLCECAPGSVLAKREYKVTQRVKMSLSSNSLLPVDVDGRRAWH